MAEKCSGSTNTENISFQHFHFHYNDIDSFMLTFRILSHWNYFPTRILALEVMLTAFWDLNGVIIARFKPLLLCGLKMNQSCYKLW